MLSLEALKGKFNDFGECIKNNKAKAALVVAIAISVSAAAATYFAFPAYRAYVSASATSSIAGISGGFASMFTYAADHPKTFGFLAIAMVAALVILAVKSYDQANQLSRMHGILNNTTTEKVSSINKQTEVCPPVA